ncbi:MAG: ABC transporter permease [Symploca sp. SIO3C6]|nr:ABC transporter permease [Symploca sp. SIO3C6]
MVAWNSPWQRFRRDRTALLGTFILCVITIGGVIGPWVYTEPTNFIDFSQASQAPSLAHPFGTNDLGQDQLARVLAGGRISLAVGMAAMTVAMSLGVLVGAIAGFYGGWIDSLLMRLTDLFLSLPQLPLLLLILYLFNDPVRALAGPEMGIFILVTGIIGGLNWMAVARLVRANFLSLRERGFILAAQSMGAHPQHLIWTHLLPNTLAPVIVAATLSVGTAIITESTLSFLGLGFPPDSPTWGRMLYDAQNYLDSSPHIAFFPGLAIFLTVLSINYIGDGLRDAIDPKA